MAYMDYKVRTVTPRTLLRSVLRQRAVFEVGADTGIFWGPQSLYEGEELGTCPSPTAYKERESSEYYLSPRSYIERQHSVFVWIPELRRRIVIFWSARAYIERQSFGIYLSSRAQEKARSFSKSQGLYGGDSQNRDISHSRTGCFWRRRRDRNFPNSQSLWGKLGIFSSPRAYIEMENSVFVQVPGPRRKLGIFSKFKSLYWRGEIGFIERERAQMIFLSCMHVPHISYRLLHIVFILSIFSSIFS